MKRVKSSRRRRRREFRAHSPHQKSLRKVIDEHDLTHLPYRSWCPICVAAGREDRHMRRTDEVEEGELTTVGMDYNFVSDGLIAGIGHEDVIMALVLKDFKTGLLWK